MEVDTTIKHAGPLITRPNVPLQLMYYCIVIYDSTKKIMIKNRYGDAHLNDAIVLKMWLDGELPIFHWKGYKEFQKRLRQYNRAFAIE